MSEQNRTLPICRSCLVAKRPESFDQMPSGLRRKTCKTCRQIRQRAIVANKLDVGFYLAKWRKV